MSPTAAALVNWNELWKVILTCAVAASSRAAAARQDPARG